MYIARVKWRNELIALVCLAAFVTLGVAYFRYWVVQKPFGIILFIGEGLTAEQITLTRLYVGGAGAHLGFESLEHLALVRNDSSDFAVPDRAAAASAIATGKKVNNHSIAVDRTGKALPNILELAHASGRIAGLVTNMKLTDATSAAFYAHANVATEPTTLARELAENGKLEVIMGGGGGAFLPVAKGGERRDARDLLLELRRGGFDVVRTRAELEAISTTRRPRLFGVFANAEMAYANQMSERAEQPSLPDMVRRAIQLLQYNTGGYVLVVDAGLARTAAEHNNAERALLHTAELDRAVAMAQRYAGPKSTIILCGDVAVGGLRLNGYPFRDDSGIALLGLNSAGEPWMTWATGPKGGAPFGRPKIGAERETSRKAAPRKEEMEPAAFYSTLALSTAEDVIALGSGRGTFRLHGYIDNTQIFAILRDQL